MWTPPGTGRRSSVSTRSSGGPWTKTESGSEKPIRTTSPIPGDAILGPGAHKLESREVDIRENSQLNIDKEMAKMVQNNLLYEANAKLLAKKFDALRLAIEAGRR